MRMSTTERVHTAAAPTPAWRSPWVIGWVALVVLVLGVNLTMVYLAIVTNPGLVNEDFYDRGQHYERTMASKLARDPGWTMRLDLPESIRVNQPSRIRVTLMDKAGQPVSPGQVRFFAYRPSDKGRDFSALMEEEAPGRFGLQVSFPLVGLWDGLVAVTEGDEEFTLGERISVAGP